MAPSSSCASIGLGRDCAGHDVTRKFTIAGVPRTEAALNTHGSQWELHKRTYLWARASEIVRDATLRLRRAVPRTYAGVLITNSSYLRIRWFGASLRRCLQVSACLDKPWCRGRGDLCALPCQRSVLCALSRARPVCVRM